MTKKTKFLAVWDCNGLETLFDLTRWEKDTKAWEKKKIWYILKEQKHPDAPPAPRLNTILARAMANTQRRYEVYIFETADIDEPSVREAFTESPQFMADFIRVNGHKIYSGYTGQKNVIN
jgi:hypothetical protein